MLFFITFLTALFELVLLEILVRNHQAVWLVLVDFVIREKELTFGQVVLLFYSGGNEELKNFVVRVLFPIIKCPRQFWSRVNDHSDSIRILVLELYLEVLVKLVTLEELFLQLGESKLQYFD